MTLEFKLDSRLEADSALVAPLGLSQARLMNDARFPWIVLIPTRAGLAELEDLAERDQHQLLREVHAASVAVRALADVNRRVTKLNVAALGNVVRQLHVHVIGRRDDDPAWPGPVWGVGAAEAYADLDAAVRRARSALPT